MNCPASGRKPPRSAASHNLLKPCPSPAPWSGSPSRRNRPEPLPLPRRQERQAAPTELTGDRGTDGSNPSPSSGESGELPYCAAGSSQSRRTPLQMGVGLATGLAVVGDLIGSGAARAVVGETPNLAARLQALAEPGAVV